MAWQEFAPTDYNSDALPGGTYGSLVGSDPLATADGDATYAETYLESGSPSLTQTVTFRLTPTPAGSFTRLKVAAEFRGVSGPPNLVVWAWPAGRPDAVNVATLEGALGDVYVTREEELDFAGLPGSLSWFTADVALAPDTHWFIQNTTPLGGGQYARTTWLRVYGYGGARPLRWRQRNDQLASGAPRAAKGVRTMQGSPGRGRGIY